MQFSRYINLSFAISGIIFFVIFWKATLLIFDTFEVTDLLIVGEAVKLTQVIAFALALGGSIYAWRRPDVQQWASEIAVELSKCTWPKWAETKQHTLVVIVFSLVLSGILAVFDFFWKWLTDLILL
jgi:preprotein translocase SecE subunit